MPIAQAKARILGAEHELPTATGRAFVASDARPLVQRHTAAFIAHTEAATGSQLPRFIKDEHVRHSATIVRLSGSRRIDRACRTCRAC
jgi:hypothetical protein